MNTRIVRFLFGITVALAIALLLLVLPMPTPARAAPTALTFTVNSNTDAPDATINGVCETGNGNGICTLRAAMMEANAAPGATINFGLGGSITYLLTLGELNITANMTIVGTGAANTIIDGNANSRILNISSPSVLVSVSGVTIRNGRTNRGAGIYNTGNLSLRNSIVISNTANTGADPKVGGGIYNTGVLTVTNSFINNNSAPSVAFTGGGGGISNVGGTVTLINSTLDSNSTNNSGGAIHVDGGTVSLLNSTVNSNTAANGGGIFNGGFMTSGTLNVTNSTITANTATQNAFNGGGGGINNSSGVATLMNSTIHSNFAYRNGGGLYDDSGGTSNLYNVTIAGNYADWDQDYVGVGGGISISGTVNIRNSILALNREYAIVCNPFCYSTFVYADCFGTLSSQDYNLIQTTSECSIVGATGNNITGSNPQLGYLQYNGGPTRTAALLPGSPAIDAGNTGGCRDGLGALIPTDQRGFGRPANGGVGGLRCDIGAFEYYSYRLFLPLIIK